MTDHLRECAERRAEWRWSEDCICDYLRACEQRLMRESIDSGSLTGERQREWWISFRMGKREGYAAGLSAAWEAVDQASSLLQPLGPALVAIDALRGES